MYHSRKDDGVGYAPMCVLFIISKMDTHPATKWELKKNKQKKKKLLLSSVCVAFNPSEDLAYKCAVFPSAVFSG